jgi:hypothetical protein
MPSYKTLPISPGGHLYMSLCSKGGLQRMELGPESQTHLNWGKGPVNTFNYRPQGCVWGVGNQ